jgi:hypothetical protein
MSSLYLSKALTARHTSSAFARTSQTAKPEPMPPSLGGCCQRNRSPLSNFWCSSSVKSGSDGTTMAPSAAVLTDGDVKPNPELWRGNARTRSVTALAIGSSALGQATRACKCRPTLIAANSAGPSGMFSGSSHAAVRHAASQVKSSQVKSSKYGRISSIILKAYGFEATGACVY